MCVFLRKTQLVNCSHMTKACQSKRALVITIPRNGKNIKQQERFTVKQMDGSWNSFFITWYCSWLRLNYYGAFAYIIFHSIITGQEFIKKHGFNLCFWKNTGGNFITAWKRKQVLYVLYLDCVVFHTWQRWHELSCNINRPDPTVGG